MIDTSPFLFLYCFTAESPENVIVTVTSPLVGVVGFIEIKGSAGAVLSILATVAVALPVFPAASIKLNVKLPFAVNG